MSDVFIVNQEDLQAFIRPGLDLLTGQLVELAPLADQPAQLDLFSEQITPLPLGLFGGTAREGKLYLIDWSRSCIVQTDCRVCELAREYHVLKDSEEVTS